MNTTAANTPPDDDASVSNDGEMRPFTIPILCGVTVLLE